MRCYARNLDQAMSANVDDEDEDDGGAIASFFCRYLGNVAVPEIQGDAIVKDAVTKMKDLIKDAGSTNERTARRTISAKKRMSRASMSVGAQGSDDGLEGAAVSLAGLVVGVVVSLDSDCRHHCHVTPVAPPSLSVSLSDPRTPRAPSSSIAAPLSSTAECASGPRRVLGRAEDRRRVLAGSDQ